MRKKGLIVISILLIFSNMSWAAVCPSLEPIPAIKGVGDFSPARVAAGAGGVTYVSDFTADKVMAFSKDGVLLNTLSLKKPLGLAVDGNGNLYVGSVRQKGSTSFTGRVDVYSGDLKFISSLASFGDGLQYPIDIEISGGTVYVVDSRANNVRMYAEADGSYLGSFGGYGSTPGSLVTPTAISADPQSGDVLVSDRALQYDSVNRVWGMGAGVTRFTASGAYVGKLPVAYADNAPAGTVPAVVPSGVHIDLAGNVYVTDSAMGDMMVFDASGALACRVALSTTSEAPQGVTITADGRLLIASSAGVMGFATASYVDMVVTPGELNLAEQECSDMGKSASVTVLNNGGGSLEWSASSDAAWLTLSQASGQIGGNGSGSLTVGIDTAALAPGAHSGVITFVSQGDTVSIPVTVNSFGAPVLSVAEGGLSFEVVGDVMPGSDVLNISLSGDVTGGMTWRASAASGWLGVTPSSGNSGTMSIAQVGIAEAGLATLDGGTYSGSVTVSTGCPSVADVVVPVTLTYVKGGTISISSNIAEATFEISGPETFSGSGASFTVPAAAPGTYNVTFGAVAGFKAPGSYTITVDYGQTASVSGNYADLREDNKIIVSMAAGDSSAADALGIFDDKGAAAGGFQVSGASGGAVGTEGSTTASGDVNGDGVDEIIVVNHGSNITVYSADGSTVIGTFRGFGDAYNGDAAPAAADMDGDGRDEIIVSSGTGSGDPADLRVFGFDGATVYDTGMFFKAYRKDLGASVAKGDVNGDGVDEFVTVSAAPAGVDRVIEVRVWGADTTQGAGSWKAKDVNTFNKGLTFDGASVAAADLNADGIDEIIVAGVPAAGSTETELNIYNVSGSLLGSFRVSGTGLYVAAGDTDFDGAAEIVVGDGPASGTGNVRVFDASGSLKTEFKALGSGNASGAKISLGQVGK